MLTELQIKNFKAWSDTGTIRLAPLTIIFGTNSSGKSSLGHLLIALKQTMQLADRKRSLHLGDDNSPIDLGTFEDCIHGHDLKKSLEFTLRWKLVSPLTVKNSLNIKETYRGDELELTSKLQANSKSNQPETVSFSYRLFDAGVKKLSVDHEKSTAASTLKSDPLKLQLANGRKWPIEAPEKFYRFADRSLLRFQNADFLAEFPLQAEKILERLYFLGPLRTPARRVYQWSGDTPQDVGAQGEHTIAALLAAKDQKRMLNRKHRGRMASFDTFIAQWMIDLGIIHSFEVQPLAEGRKEYEVLVKTHNKSHQVKLTDVGVGVSQVLPALVQAFYAPPNSTVWMEQPEIHLHPMAQSNLADLLISAVQSYENYEPRNTQLIIETHSEHLLSRLQRRIAEGVIDVKDVAVYFVNRKDADAEMEPLRLDLYGEIENWPRNFFGDEMADIAARTLATLKRQSSAKNASTA